MSAIKNIWYEYHNKLLSFIKKKVSEEVAEDILQDVFIKIHTQINSLKEAQKLESWLYQITRNTIIDYYRSRQKMEIFPEWLEQKEIENNEIIRKELSLCLEPMVQQLPDKYKKVIQLFEFEGLQQNDIAKLEGLTLSATKSRVQRGRKLLKETLLRCCEIELNSDNQLLSYDQKEPKCKIC